MIKNKKEERGKGKENLMEIDKLTSAIKQEQLEKEKRKNCLENKRKGTLLDLKKLYESYYFEGESSIRNAYRLSVKAQQFNFKVFLGIIIGSPILLRLMIPVEQLKGVFQDERFIGVILYILLLAVFYVLDYYIAGLVLKANLKLPETQKEISSYILKQMLNHELITMDDLKSNGIEEI